jgi:hypothetical protein
MMDLMAYEFAFFTRLVRAHEYTTRYEVLF